MSGRSLGMIETWGYVAAVQALDAGMKAANVHSEGCKVTPSALVTISFSGDVSAVQTAVSAGIAAAREVGKVVSWHVIARPDIQLRSRLRESDLTVVKRKTEKSTSGDYRPGVKQAAVVTGLKPEKATAGNSAARAKPKRPPAAKKGKRVAGKSKPPAGKPGSSPRKTAGRKQKKKPQREGKQPGG